MQTVGRLIGARYRDVRESFCDQQALVFNGMNFPFGEHVIYTDCQPILTFILRLLPFTHNYLIGIIIFIQ